jgi:hypothetical protein
MKRLMAIAAGLLLIGGVASGETTQWSCRQWGHFVNRVALDYIEGQSRETVTERINELNIAMHCNNCPDGIRRLAMVQLIYTQYTDKATDTTTLTSLATLGADVENKCIEYANTLRR